MFNVGRHQLDWGEVPQEGPTDLDPARELHGAVVHPTKVFVPIECGLRAAGAAHTAALGASTALDTIPPVACFTLW
ncbi:MAG: hypothetical protein ACRDQ4_15330 [Pseudonocardiaceae bacterium]